MNDPVEQTINIYDKIASQWHSKYGNLSFMRDFADIFVGHVNGKKILDLGCGPGRDAKYLSKNGFNVVGIDLSEKFLEIAKKNSPKSTFKKMDLRKLEFPENHFDGVWASASIYHIPRKQARETLCNIYNVLKKGGVVYISLLRGSGQKFLEFDIGSGRFFVYYGKEEVEALLKECGFEIIETYSSLGQVNIIREWINIFAKKV